MATGEMSEAEFTSFLTRAFSLMARYSKDGSIQFICMDWRHARELLEAGSLAYTELKNICVWVNPPRPNPPVKTGPTIQHLPDGSIIKY